MKTLPQVMIVVVVLASAGVSLRAALGDEQNVPLVVSGGWMAWSHSPSETAPPDICGAVTETQNGSFILRQSSEDLEVRFADDSWSLPAGVSGTLLLKAGSYREALPITYNDNDMVAATLSVAQLQSLLSAMDKAERMTVTPGNAAPETVSLNGSNKATTAFLTCAGLTAPGEGGGTNPFQSATPPGNAGRSPPQPSTAAGASEDAAGPVPLGSFANWTAATYRAFGHTVCYAFSRPTDSSPELPGRGQVMLSVTERPSARDETAFTAGFAYASNAVATATTSSATFSLHTAGDAAFADDGAGAVHAFQSAPVVVIRSPGPSGTVVSDTFSLGGFPAAYAAMAKACPGE